MNVKEMDVPGLTTRNCKQRRPGSRGHGNQA